MNCVFFVVIGSRASSAFTRKVIARDLNTPFLLYSNPDIAILGSNKPHTIEHLKQTILSLQQIGCKQYAMLCNTAHMYLPTIYEQAPALDPKNNNNNNIKLIPIIDLVAQEIVRKHGSKVRIGLLSTKGVIDAKLYHDALARASQNEATVLIPETDALVQQVHDCIFTIIKGSNTFNNKDCLEWFKEFATHMKTVQKCDAVVFCCTDIGDHISTQDISADILPCYDPVDSLVDYMLASKQE